MIYKSVTLHSLVSRILRVVRGSESDYIDDISQWIQEGVKSLKIKNTTIELCEDLTICNHSARMPCGITSISGIVYNGCRLREGAYTSLTASKANIPNAASSNLYTSDIASKSSDIRGTNIKEVTNVSTVDFYKIQMDALHFTMKEGTVRIFYRGLPTDEEGYLLIPDLEPFKEALIWYVFKWLTLSGFRFPDPRINSFYCEEMFEKYARRAKNSAKTLSTDRKEALLQSTRKLLPPEHFYDNFGVNSEQINPSYTIPNS